MKVDGWRLAPLAVTTDLRCGGRWTSLRTPEREWLWSNPDSRVAAARCTVRPGEEFIDAGGVEECLPTVRGRPDHGDAWSRPWQHDGDGDAVDIPEIGRLTRRISVGRPLIAAYSLVARPGAPFLHAVHALLELGCNARLEIPGCPRMRVLDVTDADRLWPSGLDTLGPDDGTAVCALLPDCHEATVIDGEHALSFHWTSPDAPELCSLLFWRNLRGWPASAPYRSIGIEPMVGRAADLSTADSADCVRLGPDGRFRWTLTLTAWRRHDAANSQIRRLT